MDIKTSLKIEDYHQGKINLFISGSFVMVYNLSFYLLTEKLGRKLKANARKVISADSRFVISGGFPLSQVAKDYPTAKRTGWGFQIEMNFDTVGYAAWLLPYKQAAKAVANTVTAVVPSCSDNGQGGTTVNKKIKVQKIGKYCLFLNEQQMFFLLNLNWQVAHNLTEQDIHFISSLKQLALNYKAFSQNQYHTSNTSNSHFELN